MPPNTALEPLTFARAKARDHGSENALLVSLDLLEYRHPMFATAVVEGKVVRFKLSPALARAHRENRSKTMTEQEAVAFVETKRRARALRRAKPYFEGCS